MLQFYFLFTEYEKLCWISGISILTSSLILENFNRSSYSMFSKLVFNKNKSGKDFCCINKFWGNELKLLELHLIVLDNPFVRGTRNVQTSFD